MASYHMQHEDLPRCEPAAPRGGLEQRGLEQHLAELDAEISVLDELLEGLKHRLSPVLLPEEDALGGVPADAPSRTPTADYVDSMVRRVNRMARQVSQITAQVYL